MPSRSVDEVAERFAEYINRVVDQGETLTLTRNGEPIAELRPAPRALTVGEWLDALATLPHVDPDDREQFARNLEAAHAELNSLPLPGNPWES